MNKVSRVKDDNFTTISNVFLRDKNISIKAKGFLAVVMGLPSDWEFSINGICATLKEGKTAIYNVINELKENKYCNVVTIRDEKGCIIGNDYTFYEEPYKEEPYLGFPNMDNQPQLNTYSNNKEIDKKKNNDNNIEEWRKDFNAYLEIVNKAKLELLRDTTFKADKEKYYPNLDYELSIEKIVKEYWGTEQGWEKRRKGKSKSLDMVRTLKKAFDYATNRVYKRMQPQQGIATTQQKQSAPKPFNYTRAPLHPMLRFVNEKGVLNDGTFIEDGYRYYISPTSGQKYSIPCNASKRPSDKHDFDNLTKMWYIKEQEENSIFNDIW